MATPHTSGGDPDWMVKELARRDRIVNGEDNEVKKKRYRVRPRKDKGSQADGEKANGATNTHVRRPEEIPSQDRDHLYNNDILARPVSNQQTGTPVQPTVPTFIPLSPPLTKGSDAPQLPIASNNIPQKPTGSAIQGNAVQSQEHSTKPIAQFPKIVDKAGVVAGGSVDNMRGCGGLNESRWSNAKDGDMRLGTQIEAKKDMAAKLNTKLIPIVPTKKESVCTFVARNPHAPEKYAVTEAADFEGGPKPVAQKSLENSGITFKEEPKNSISEVQELKMLLTTSQQQQNDMKYRLTKSEETAIYERSQAKVLEDSNRELEAAKQALERRIAFQTPSNFDQQKLRVLESRCAKAEDDCRALWKSNGELVATQQGLENRIIAFQGVSDFEQKQLKDTADKLHNMQNAWAMAREQLRNSEQRCINHDALVRERGQILSDLKQAREDSRGSRNDIYNSTVALKQVTTEHEGCAAKFGGLEAKFNTLTERLTNEQVMHIEAKQQLEEAQSQLAAVALQLAACKADLKNCELGGGKLPAKARDLESPAAEKRSVDMGKLAEELVQEKESNDFDESLLPQPAQKKRKNRQQRNRKFDPEKEARKLEKEAKRLEAESKPASKALVLYRPHNSRFLTTAQPSQSLGITSQAVSGPLPTFDFGLMARSAKDSMAMVLYENIDLRAPKSDDRQLNPDSLLEIETDSHIYHGNDRLGYINNWIWCRAQDIKHGLKGKRASGKVLSSEAGRSAKRNTYQFLIGTVCMISAMTMLYAFLPWQGGFNKPNYVSAAPSCEVFGSDLSVVETTCPWEPPKPSSLAPFAPSTLPVFQPSSSEMLWIDNGNSNENCSSLEKPAQEQSTDEDTCEVPREVNKRRIAIGITVTVVIPTVVVGVIAFSFGWI